MLVFWEEGLQNGKNVNNINQLHLWKTQVALSFMEMIKSPPRKKEEAGQFNMLLDN